MRIKLIVEVTMVETVVVIIMRMEEIVVASEIIVATITINRLLSNVRSVRKRMPSALIVQTVVLPITIVIVQTVQKTPEH